MRTLSRAIKDSFAGLTFGATRIDDVCRDRANNICVNKEMVDTAIEETHIFLRLS